MDFSSWPRDQEQTFVVYEQRSNESSRKAITAAAIAAIGVFVLLVGIYAGVEPEKKDYTKDMNMSNLTKKHKAAAAEEAPAPKAEAPAPAPAPAAPATDKK
ncbi:MAG TPA: hypothetical protein VFQ65_08910 [Kofleriaceae bacterium]|nr:hypothetical protein [Kofleriaceae bacterium]